MFFLSAPIRLAWCSANSYVPLLVPWNCAQKGVRMRYLVLLLFSLGSVACVTTQEDEPTAQKPGGIENVAYTENLKARNRELINRHVRELAQSLVAQPVMTPRPGFSGYLAHFQVFRTTTKDSPYVVIVDGEGYTESDLPSELQDFAALKGAHPYGGTYAFSGTYPDMSSKDRQDTHARMTMEIPSSKGDGMMAIGYADGSVEILEALGEELDDKDIQSILAQ
jgi:hypothetical protein